jgi:putative lipoprotein
VRGELTKQADALRFTVCGAPESSVVPLSGKTAEITDAWQAMAGGDDGALYVELRGAPDRAAFRVEELVRARPVGEGARCAQPVFDGDFVVSGNEPFWAVEIRSDGITYRSPEMPKGRTYPYAVTRAAGQPVYATRIDGPSASMLEIEIKPKRCVDSMSGEIRSFEARVVLDGRELHGCAAAGVPPGEFGDGALDELRRYAGTYEPFWKRGPLHQRLATLLGAKLPAFESRFQVAGPLREDGGVYYATGNMAHQGGSDVAAFLADPDTDTINVVIVEDGKREDFKEGDREVTVPAEVRTFLSK